jgi:hypothetical protein
MNQSLLGDGLRCVTLSPSAKSDRRNTIRKRKDRPSAEDIHRSDS